MKVALMSDLHYGFGGNTANKIRKCFFKLQKENPDVIVLAGDIATTRQYEYKRCLETVRDYFPDIPILIVRGNHDLWEDIHRKDPLSGSRNLTQIYQYHEQIYKFNNIHHLDEPYKIGDVTFFGFDGWYYLPNPNTNDQNWIPRDYQGCPTMTYLSGNSFKDFDRVLDQYDDQKNVKNVLVSHFPSIVIENDRHDFNASPRFLDEITCRFDVVCYGHTHRYMNQEVDGAMIYNCGSDYNQPKYLLFEI